MENGAGRVSLVVPTRALCLATRALDAGSPGCPLLPLGERNNFIL